MAEEQEEAQQQAQEGQEAQAAGGQQATQQSQQQAQEGQQQGGQTVNRHKHEREVARLEAERDAALAEVEGFKGLKAEFEQWKAAQEAKESEAALKAAGCIDAVAASARLAEFDGDIDKLKEAAPYLFASADASKSTGGRQKGAPDPEDERAKRYRSIMGLTEKE